MSLETNPIALAIQESIREMLLNDFSKADVRETIKSAHPDFPAHLFDSVYSEAFCSIM